MHLHYLYLHVYLFIYIIYMSVDLSIYLSVNIEDCVRAYTHIHTRAEIKEIVKGNAMKT